MSPTEHYLRTLANGILDVLDEVDTLREENARLRVRDEEFAQFTRDAISNSHYTQIEWVNALVGRELLRSKP